MYKYNVGVFGGTFNPIHNGHIKCVEKAVKECRKLHIIVSDTLNRTSVDFETKMKWMHMLFDKYPNIVYHKIIDETYSKSEYTKELWIRDSNVIKEVIGEKIDVVYCGADYNTETSLYGLCFPESEIIFIDRGDNISSSRFRNDPKKYNSDVPDFVAEYYNNL